MIPTEGGAMIIVERSKRIVFAIIQIIFEPFFREASSSSELDLP